MIGSIWNLQIAVHGASSLIKTRGLIQGFGRSSYRTFDAVTRSISKLEKSTGRMINRFSSMALGGGLAYTAFKTLNYSLLQSNSLIKTNTILMEEMTGNKNAVKGYMTVIQDLSASFGQDMNEMMGAAKSMVQVMNQAGKTSPQALEKMMKLIMATSMLDTENRGLGYTAFSYREMFQGLGRADFRSMKSRLEINLGKTMEQAIVRAIRSGNVDEATDLIVDAFRGVGIDANKIMGRLLNEGLVQNIHRTATYVNRFFQMIGADAYTNLARPFKKLNDFLSQYFSLTKRVDESGKVFYEPSEGLKQIENYGRSLNNTFIEPFINKLSKLGNALKNMKGNIWNNFIGAIKGVGSAFGNFFLMFTSFMQGLFGQKSDLVDFNETAMSFSKILEMIGKGGNYLGRVFKNFQEPLNELGLSLNKLVTALTNFLNINAAKVEGGVLGFLAKTAIGTVTTGVEATAGGLNLVKNLDVGGVLSGIMTTMMMASMLRGGFRWGKGKLGKRGKDGIGDGKISPTSKISSGKRTPWQEDMRAIGGIVHRQENKVRQLGVSFNRSAKQLKMAKNRAKKIEKIDKEIDKIKSHRDYGLPTSDLQDKVRKLSQQRQKLASRQPSDLMYLEESVRKKKEILLKEKQQLDAAKNKEKEVKKQHPDDNIRGTFDWNNALSVGGNLALIGSSLFQVFGAKLAGLGTRLAMLGAAFTPYLVPLTLGFAGLSIVVRKLADAKNEELKAQREINEQRNQTRNMKVFQEILGDANVNPVAIRKIVDKYGLENIKKMGLYTSLKGWDNNTISALHSLAFTNKEKRIDYLSRIEEAGLSDQFQKTFHISLEQLKSPEMQKVLEIYHNVKIKNMDYNDPEIQKHLKAIALKIIENSTPKPEKDKKKDRIEETNQLINSLNIFKADGN